MSFGTDRTSDFLQTIKYIRTPNPPLNGAQIDNSSVIKPDLQPLILQDNVSYDHLFQTGGSTSNGQVSSHVSDLKYKHINSNLTVRSQFTAVASMISQDLAATCSKLENLNTLARQRTLFDDRSVEIYKFTLEIKEDIANLNHRIADLQSLSKSHPVKGNQSAKHSSSVLMSLQTRLANMSSQFKGVLEHRSEALQAQATRKSEYSALSCGLPQLSRDHEERNISSRPRQTIVPSTLLQDEENARASMDGHMTEDCRDEVAKYDFAGQQQMYKQIAYKDQTSQYIISRCDTVRTIEHTIVELGEIFQQLATMVHEQEESVQRIDANVEDAVASVEAGHNELLRYLHSISSNRWLMLKAFGILFTFFVLFVIFFV